MQAVSIVIGCLVFIALLSLALHFKQTSDKETKGNLSACPQETPLDKRFNFFFVIMLLAIVPITSAEIQERNMLFVGLAACPILAQVIFFCIDQARLALTKFKSVFYAATATLLLSGHLLLSALLMAPMSYAPKIMAQPAIKAAFSLPEDIQNKKIISIGTPLFDASYLSAIRLSEKQTVPVAFWNVSTQISNSQVSRIDEYRLLIQRKQGLLGGGGLFIER